MGRLAEEARNPPPPGSLHLQLRHAHTLLPRPISSQSLHNSAVLPQCCSVSPCRLQCSVTVISYSHPLLSVCSVKSSQHPLDVGVVYLPFYRAERLREARGFSESRCDPKVHSCRGIMVPQEVHTVFQKSLDVSLE